MELSDYTFSHQQGFNKRTQKSNNLFTINSENISGCEVNNQILQKLLPLCKEKNCFDLIIAEILPTDELNVLKSSDLQSIRNLCSDKSIIFVLQIEKNPNFLIFWKLKECQCFLSVELKRKFSLEESVKIKEFLKNFLSASIKNNHIGIISEFPITSEQQTVELDLLADHRDFNLLMLASERGNADLVELLLKFGLKTKRSDNNTEAQTLAYLNEHWDVLYVFLQANLTFPKSFVMSKCAGRFKEFCEITQRLHESIESNNISKVIPILNRNKNLRYFYNFQNQSALKIALVSKSFDTFDILLGKKYRFGPHEDPAECYEGLTQDEKEIICSIQNKHSRSFVDKYIHRLVENSTACFDETEAEDKRMYVERAFKLLSENFLVRIILMIVSASKNFKIFFDFNRDAVNIVDPSASRHSEGVMYMSGKIYIGAKQLLDQATEHKALGVLAHELCHYALAIVFKNDSNPYRKDDRKAKIEFETVTQISRVIIFRQTKNEREDIITSVYFDYPEEDHHAELIVRVVHLIMLYRNQPVKLTELRKKFAKLFEFYEKRIVPELVRVLPEIETSNEKEMHKKDKKISKLRKITIICLVLSIFSIIAGGFLAWHFYEPNYVFSNLQPQEKNKVRNGTIFYKFEKIRMCDLFPQDSIAYKKLTSEEISDLLHDKDLNFSDPNLMYLDKLVVVNWKNLTTKLKRKFLNSNFTFQGMSLKFQKLNDLIPNAFNSITSEQLNFVLDGRELKVHEIIKNETVFCVERELRDENIDEIYFDFMVYLHGNLTEYCSEYKNNSGHTTNFEDYYWSFIGQNFSTQVEKIKKIKYSKNYKYCSVYDLKILDPHNRNIIVDRLIDHPFYNSDFDEILTFANRTKIFILSTEAGKGKTIVFEQLTLRIKNLFPLKWVSYIDLKKFKHFYNFKINTSDGRYLLEKILNLNTQNEFELQVFRNLYYSGNVILLWNGFDEISPYYSDFILNILKNIKETTENIQLINTRPLYADQLRRVLKSQVFTLVPLNYQKQEEFLRKFFTHQKIQAPKITYYVQKVQNIVKSTMDFGSSEDFDSPLLLSMIAELISSDIEIYKSENLFDIYQKFVTKKIELWQQKSEFALNFTKRAITEYRKFDMMEVYQKYAIISEMSDKTYFPYIYKNSTRLKILQQKFPKDLTNDEISRMGILYINGPKIFKFAHRTYPEFFIAQFFIDNLSNLDKIIDVFYYVTKYYRTYQENITRFLVYYFRSKTSRASALNVIPNNLKSKFRDIFFNIHRKDSLYFEFLFNLLKNDHDYFTELLRIDESETLYTASYNFRYYEPFQRYYVDHSVIRNISRRFLSENEYEKFINGRNQKGIFMFSIFCYEKYTRNSDVISNEYKLSNEFLKSKNDFFVFDSIVQNLTKSEIKELLTSESSPLYERWKVKLHTKAEFWTKIDELLTKDEQKEMLVNILDEDTVWNLKENKIFIQKIKIHLSSSEIYEIFSKKNILHRLIAEYYSFDDVWSVLTSLTNIEQQKLLLSEKAVMKCYFYDFQCILNAPLSIIQLASIGKNFQNHFRNVTKIYEKYFNRRERQNIIENSDGFLPDFIVFVKNEDCKTFIEYLNELYGENEDLLLNFLLKKVLASNMNIFEYLRDYPDPKNCLERFKTLKNSLIESQQNGMKNLP